MHMTALRAGAALSNEELLRRVEALAAREREATAELVAHLAELDTRRLYLAEGFASLFSYCTDALRLAEHAAYNRIEAARTSRRFPVILELLAKGALNVSTVRLLAPHLTEENHQVVLAEASGRSKRAVEEIVARLAPRPDAVAIVRKLPAPPSAAPMPVVPVVEAAGMSVDMSVSAAAAVAGPPAHRPAVTPLAPERYRVQFTVGRETHEKLRRAQDLLRREIPDGDPGAIFDRALTLLLDDVARKRLAATPNPRPSRGAVSPRARRIPAEIKRAVWLRDGGQCAFVARSGRRCRERTLLEFHHVEPYGIGGETTVGNLSLRCRAHNVHEAVLDFGDLRAFHSTRPGAS
jgi:hypothetical protein